MKKQYSNLFNTTFNLKDRATLSVSALEKNLLHSSKQKRRFEDKLNDKLPLTTTNTTQFKIVSPFYDRNKVCKASNCHCPFHKRLREQASKKYQMRSRKVFNSTLNSPKKDRESREREQHERLSHKIQPNNKENSSLQRGDTESRNFHRNKLNSFNFQFDQFLKLANQALLDKLNYRKVNEHVVKSSVGQIFKYIYDNLDKDRTEITDHIQGIQKDRDITNFYLDRYEDLKRRRTAKERDKTYKMTINKEASQAHSRATSKTITRNFEKQPTVARKTHKEKTQRVLLIEKLIKCVKEGNEVDGDEVNDIAILSIEPFEDNCNHLKRKIGVFDIDMLESVRQDIVQQLQRKLIALNANSGVAQEDHEKKREIVKNLLASITQRIEQLAKDQENEYQREKYDRVGSSYSKSSLTRKGSIDFQGKKKNSKFIDMERKPLLIDENPASASSESYQELMDSLRQSNRDYGTIGVHNSPRNLRPEQGKINQDEQLSDLPQALKKNQGKLKLAKYRRLSHQGFFQKRISEGEEGFFIPKIHIDKLQDIGPRLDALAIQFGEKWKKIKEIERRISDLKMKKYIVFQNDDLITAKRKIHMLKTLLKGQVFEGNLKEEIKEYINLIEQFNLLKNRTWAERKLKNMLKYNDDISISEINEEPTEDNFHKLVEGMCGNRNKLLYYVVQATQFQEKELNLEGQLFDLIDKGLKMQKLRSKKSEKKKTNVTTVPTSKEQQQEDREEGNLIQKGLSNHYSSQLCYDKSQNLLVKPNERQKEYTFNQKEASEIYSHFKYFNKMYF